VKQYPIVGTTRRAVLASIAAALAPWPRIAQAQPRTPVVAIVTPSTPIEQVTEKGPLAYWRVFFAELRRRGRIEGETITIERYSAQGRAADFPALAQTVTARKPDVIVASTNDLVGAFKRATTSIPIVGSTGDPISTGLVSNLARPGGNITGVSIDPGTQLAGKRLEVLKEAVPHLARVGYIGSRTAWEQTEGEGLREAAKRMGIDIIAPLFGDQVDQAEYRRVFSALVQQHVGAVVVSPSNENVANRQIIVDFAQSERLPAVYPFRDYVEIGGLFAYGPDLPELFRRLADEVDEILQGAKPGDIPYTLPTKLTLIVNRKTAAALGLTIPPTLLIRADEVIE
jgi:putative tryptophan/tyrosine transport system substrate-binding protein